MSYRNDQFFNLPTGTEVGAEDLVHAPDNPPFVYPERVVRTIDEKGNPVSRTLQRGYIRSLANSIGGVSYPIKKCAFQFNPATIQQMVTQNDSMLNFIQQDPGQYIQPMPGNVNFAFELMFDRSMEMNQPSRGPSHAEQEGSVPVTDLNPWELEDPSEVGVLRDLAAFYAAVGQGMSQSQKAYVLQALTANINREAASQTTTTADGTATATSPDVALNALPSFLDMNVGNSAFLLPLPVRVVFSSLYIVEGLVQNTSVTFTKFSTSMVPMQCVLGVTMEAKYIGFAKKRTFLSVAIEDQKTQFDQEAKSEQDQIASVYSAFAAAGSSMETTTDIGFSPGDNSSEFPNVSHTLPNMLQASQARLRTWNRLPNAISAPDTGRDRGFQTVSPNTDLVGKLFEDGIALNIGTQSTIAVYGPFTSVPNTTQAGLKSRTTGTAALYTTLSTSGVTTKEQWQKMIKGVTQDPTQSVPQYSGYDINSNYFVVRYSGSVNVGFMGSNSISGTGEVYELVTPAMTASYTLRHTIPLTWPGYTATTTTGTVPPDNAATAPKPAGSTSNVGAPKPTPRIGPS